MTDTGEADTIKSRKGKYGPRGIDWYKYYDGVPPEDDDCDYEWSGSFWNIIWRDE